MVNNTILFTRPGIANAVLVQLGQESVEMHNNVIHQTGSGAAPNILRVHEASEVETPYCAPTSREPWSSGRKVAGSNNWVQTSATLVPAELTGTIRGADPQLTNIGQGQLRPLSHSQLVSSGNPSPTSPPGFPFPSPLALPQFDPPQRAKMAIGAEVPRVPGARIDIGAFEAAGVPPPLTPRNGSAPLIPPPRGGSAGREQPGAGAVPAAVALPSAGTGGGAGVAGALAAMPAGTGQASVKDTALRITPPIVRLWWTVSRWLHDLSRKDATARR